MSLRQPGRNETHRLAGARKSFRKVALRIAAADDDIGFFIVPQAIEHARQKRFVMLEVGVDDGDIGRGRSEHRFGAGGGQTTAAKPLHAAHTAITPGQFAHAVGRSVGRIVVDKNHLPAEPLKRGGEPRHQRLDIVTFIERRRDDCEIGALIPGRGRVRPPDISDF